MPDKLLPAAPPTGTAPRGPTLRRRAAGRAPRSRLTGRGRLPRSPAGRGLLAHELAHVRNRDTLVGAMAATLAGAVAMLADAARWSLMFGGFGQRDEREQGAGSAVGAVVALVLAPLAATLVQLAISRSREFLA
ncbi:MAG: M48 family metalloprotease, partial [bacterium]